MPQYKYSQNFSGQYVEILTVYEVLHVKRHGDSNVWCNYSQIHPQWRNNQLTAYSTCCISSHPGIKRGVWEVIEFDDNFLKTMASWISILTAATRRMRSQSFVFAFRHWKKSVIIFLLISCTIVISKWCSGSLPTISFCRTTNNFHKPQKIKLL